jgi:2-dehydro-3-deoxy-D-arabinonate dehydratase
MPICAFRPRESAHDDRVLGWVDPNARSIAPISGTIGELLRLNAAERARRLQAARAAATFHLGIDDVYLLAPVDDQEVWAAGVTYARSRDARMEESTQQDVYDRVYDAERPEIFFKANGWRCKGHDDPVGIRPDSNWNVPEPELALVLDAHGEVAGYTIGNDVSSRSIEGENPLYLPQAKIYNGSCALGPWIVLPDELPDPLRLGIQLTIERDGREHWRGESHTSQLHRALDELAAHLYDVLDFPAGAVLLTGTGIIPPSEFSLAPGDVVTVRIDGIGALTNHVVAVASRRRKAALP